MSQEELVQAFSEGRLSRRAFVRQLVDDGMSMPAALAYADALAPATASSSAPRSPAPSGADARSRMSAKPSQARGLEINFVGDGYLVYHPARDRMHSLNHTAALVLELCTGENDEAEVARLLQRCYELPHPPEEETRQCLETLFDEGLIR